MFKKRIIMAVLPAVFIWGCSHKNKSMEELKKEIESRLEIINAHFGIAFKDPQTGDTVYINAKQSFHAASTMKTPVLAELFKQADSGKFSMDDSITIRNSFRSIVDSSDFSLDPNDDSELELYTRLGEKETIAKLAYEMIIRSSNLATNLLIGLAGPDNIMESLKAMGANDMKVLRGVEDNKAFQKGLNNTTTAHDLALLFERMAEEKLVSAEASQAMIRILLDQQFNEIIPARLPGDVKVAHKTGSITGVQHDSGIVYLPDGRKYVLVLLSRFDPADEKKVITAMAEVSRLIYDHVMR